MRDKMLRHHNKVVKMLKNDQEALGEVMNLKLLVVREEWNKWMVKQFVSNQVFIPVSWISANATSIVTSCWYETP